MVMMVCLSMMTPLTALFSLLASCLLLLMLLLLLLMLWRLLVLLLLLGRWLLLVHIIGIMELDILSSLRGRYPRGISLLTNDMVGQKGKQDCVPQPCHRPQLFFCYTVLLSQHTI